MLGKKANYMVAISKQTDSNNNITELKFGKSSEKVDELFAELFLLLAWFSLGNANYKYISGIFLGLAMGARPNNVIFIIPMMIGLFLKQ